MHKTFLIGLTLGLAAPALHAMPIPFNTETYTVVDGVTLLDDTFALLQDDFTDSAPPSILPLGQGATVASLNGSSATALATADTRTLTVATGAFVSAPDLSATTISLATFSGDFIALTPSTRLRLDFDGNGSLFGDGSVLTELVLQVLGGGLTLFNRTLTLSGADSLTQTFSDTFDLAPGATGTLEILLSSSGSADPAAEALGQANLSFALESVAAVAVPAPSTALSLILGLGLLGFTSRRATGG